ncbi:spore coat polysaccharide biosynthesis protein SpsF (cytidylyltransferase family) [Sphingomonas leidyi]|uniref:Spore coat polysaccharide biosynthesis protein SpsF (Cytidylyltransferase family) n=1 Tax=Sphingomonas leidyi TaxID=68569 RepID=A0A7X5ZU16_9SPHN|nr:glycosyltransferase family protein [Sphingomonas leidyi]NIJ63642.1 spore coat polysaccharide biosynthesis protein SpsF (cytidylyltransferase family) [Sphingomonas leidyi]
MRCFVQARMGSTRLPGKVLMEAAGKPLLTHLFGRLRRAELLDGFCVITSTLAQDDPIAEWADANGIDSYRGSEDDVLDRYYQAAKQFGVDHVVRVTADCPIIDPAIVDEAVRLARQEAGSFDLLTNRYPITFPDGMDVDVIPFASLEQAWREAGTRFQREHVIPFFWEEGRRVRNFESATNYFHTHRWTLDYPEDYQLLKAMIEMFPGREDSFTLQDALDLIAADPGLAAINAMHLPG